MDMTINSESVIPVFHEGKSEKKKNIKIKRFHFRN